MKVELGNDGLVAGDRRGSIQEKIRRRQLEWVLPSSIGIGCEVHIAKAGFSAVDHRILEVL